MSIISPAALPLYLFFLTGLPLLALSAADKEAPLPVTITVDASKPIGPLKPIWRFFGADEPNYATLKNGKKLLSELGNLASDQVYFRAHNLLTTGDGTPSFKWGSTNVYTEDAAGNPIYDWTIIDEIFDAYRANGVRPLVELGFMPKAMSTHPEPYQHHWTPYTNYGEIFTGWTYPPKDYAKWGELCYQLANHFVKKYGSAEVETWWWQTWNEYNGGYWKGTFEEYHKLYDYSVAGVRRALPNARIGGPSTAAGTMKGAMAQFLQHTQTGKNFATGEIGTPLEMISFHAKGGPAFVDGHVRMGISNQLKEIDDAFALIASYPQLKKTPIILTETDPEGCAACQGPKFSYRNGTMYSSYPAASFARIQDLALKHEVNLEGALTWAFEFEDQGHFAGFRVLASEGIDHPVLNIFRMFSKMSGQRLTTQSDVSPTLDQIIKDGVRTQPDVSAFASMRGNQLAVMIWNYHDDDLTGPSAAITLKIPGLPVSTGKAALTHYRVDETHSNAFTVWRALGEPKKPDPSQYAELEAAGKLEEIPATPVSISDHTLNLSIDLPRQGVSLLILKW